MDQDERPQVRQAIEEMMAMAASWKGPSDPSTGAVMRAMRRQFNELVMGTRSLGWCTGPLMEADRLMARIERGMEDEDCRGKLFDLFCLARDFVNDRV